MTTTGKKPRVRTIVLVFLAVVLVTAGGIGVYAWTSLTTIMPGGGIIEPFNGRYNIALLGSDSADWREGARVDSTTVVSVDAETGRALLISIPRNLVEIPFAKSSPLYKLYPGGFVCPNQALEPCMLTMVYQLGLDHSDLYPKGIDPGSQAMVDAIEGITGLRINYFAFIDMDGFENLIDAMGGITMTIRTRIPVGVMDEIWYWIEPGEQHFTGDEALWYLRTRVGTDDYDRMTREKCVMLTILDQLGPQTISTHFTKIMKAASQTARTNIPASQSPMLMSLASKANSWTMTTLNLSPPLIDPLNPDYSKIRREVSQAIAYVEALDEGNAGPDTQTSDLSTTCGY